MSGEVRKRVPRSAGSSFATEPRAALFQQFEQFPSHDSFDYREIYRDR